ncbi:hypothetical protein BDW67DRAFT_79691 [Aspergillus spinulosporus]
MSKHCQLKLASSEYLCFQWCARFSFGPGLSIRVCNPATSPSTQVHVRGYIRHNQELLGSPQLSPCWLCYIHIPVLFFFFVLAIRTAVQLLIVCVYIMHFLHCFLRILPHA